MLQLKYQSFNLEFQYPFTIAKGTKNYQPTLIVSLGLGPFTGYGEAPAIHYYDVTIEKMQDILEAKKQMISRYALTEPQRFWHFLEHLLPEENFLIAALDMAGWDLFAQLRRQPLYRILGLNKDNAPLTDYTIGIDTPEKTVEKLKAHPAPFYKIKIRKADDLDLIITLRKATDKPFRVDANESLSFEEARRLIPEMKKLGVELLEQPLAKNEWEAMEALKSGSSLNLFADESCVEETDVERCARAFHGINIKLTKCGGITPALRMIPDARKRGLKIMLGCMNESSVGTAAVAHLLPLAQYADVDGPMLLKEDLAGGLSVENGNIRIPDAPGLGIVFYGEKKPK